VKAVVGDITPFDGISKDAKKQLEDEAMKKMLQELGDNPVAQEIYELFSEYEHQQSDEAKFIKEVDKLEMLLQGNFYEQSQGKNLSQFFDSTPIDGFKNPLIKGVAQLAHNSHQQNVAPQHDGTPQ
jgi:putative hydrolase of HD superfamily